MIITAKNSRAISFLLWIKNSVAYDIGIINGKYYSYTRYGAFVFDLRSYYHYDSYFPGIRNSKRKISIYDLLALFTTDFIDNFHNSY